MAVRATRMAKFVKNGVIPVLAHCAKNMATILPKVIVLTRGSKPFASDFLASLIKVTHRQMPGEVALRGAGAKAAFWARSQAALTHDPSRAVFAAWISLSPSRTRPSDVETV